MIRGLLADEELAGAMQRQELCCSGFGLDKPQFGPGHCLANGLGISGIVLLPLDIGLYIGRRHQTHGMAKRLELT